MDPFGPVNPACRALPGKYYSQHAEYKQNQFEKAPSGSEISIPPSCCVPPGSVLLESASFILAGLNL
jgi:hypothetical protein